MSKKHLTSCGDCKYQMSGFDGGFFGLPVTCECRFFGETENRKSCSRFEKKITKDYLFERIRQLEKENDNCKNDYRELFSDYVALEEKNEKLQKQVDNLQDALAEICATLIMNGLEIEFDGKNLSELIDI